MSRGGRELEGRGRGEMDKAQNEKEVKGGVIVPRGKNNINENILKKIQ